VAPPDAEQRILRGPLAHLAAQPDLLEGGRLVTERFLVGLDLAYEQPAEATAEDAADRFERVMEALLLAGQEDAGVGVDTERRRVSVSVAAEGQDAPAAIALALSAIRAAVAEAGLESAGWSTRLEQLTATPAQEPLVSA
jgi:hypothetical protein